MRKKNFYRETYNFGVDKEYYFQFQGASNENFFHPFLYSPLPSEILGTFFCFENKLFKT